MLTPSDLDALQEAESKATPGPWKEDFGIYESLDEYCDYDDLAYARGPMVRRVRGESYEDFKDRAKPDAALMAMTRNALPDLIAMARRALAAESAAARRLEVLRRVFDGYGDAMDLDLRNDIARELEGT